MNISALFIGRPVATWLLALAVLLGGIIGYMRLPVSALPQVDFPTIQVTTQLPGASADTVASLITAPLERQFGLIAGLSTMLSTSAEGTSAITLQFSLEKNLDEAAEDVQAAINAAQGVLPQNLPYPPSYSKVNPADPAIITLALTSDTLPLTALNDTADTVLAQKLSQISGVGRVLVQGGQRPAYRVQIDPVRLAAYGLTLEDVRTALGAANVNLPKGSFDGPSQSLSLGVNDQIKDVEGYRQLVLATANGLVVRVKDVGDVIQGLENARVGGWVNGKPGIIVDVQRQPGANIVATADAIKAALPQLETAIPSGVTVEILADRTETIRASVHDVQFTLFLTVGLVILVVFLFLRSFRATIVPGVALPLSLVGTLGLMSVFGFSLDNLSLMALTIAAGFVVDDAIVMIENIVRHIEDGDQPMEAAYKGAKEISFTIVSLTVSLIAVFIPLLFMTGIVGRLFREFALTLTFAVIVSMVISLTLTPMMSARLMRAKDLEKNKAQKDNIFTKLLNGYGNTLNWVLDRPRATLLSFFLTLVVTGLLYVVIPKGFLPLEDTGQIIATTDAAETISYAELSRLQDAAARIVDEDPDVAHVASFLGVGTVNITPNTGRMNIILKPKADRDASAQDIIERLEPKLRQVAGLEVHMQAAQDIQIGARSSRTQYQYTLTDLDGDELTAFTAKLVSGLKQDPLFADVATDQEDAGLTAHIEVDRAQAQRLGVLPEAIDNTLYNAFGQRQISTVYSQVNQYRVILEASPDFAQDQSILSKLYVRGANNALVPFGAFAKLDYKPTPLVVTHQGQFPAVTVSFNLAKNASLGKAIDRIDSLQQEIGMPDTITAAFNGDAAEFRASLASQPLLILAAAIVIYIVLGVLYESTLHPITILSTLPSAGAGALLALWLTGSDLSLVGIIGIILLMGIVKKNAIMMIDFALEAERNEGLNPREAIHKASVLRFRPIMMTTMAALLGAIPLAIDQGMGAELRRPLGIAIVGGLLLSQLLTLYTTPVIYLAMERLKQRYGSKKEMADVRL